jgi:hypothetical protein
MSNHCHPEDGGVISPAAFILDLESLMPSELDLNELGCAHHLEPAPKSLVDEGARTNSR